MNLQKIIFIVVCPFLLPPVGRGASFQNLDFESTSLPANGPGGLQPVEVALPGWSALLGDEPASGILYNDMFLGTAFVGLSGNSFEVLDGQFSVMVKPGSIHFPGISVSASLAQTGLIPVDAGILQFRANIATFNPTVRDFFGVYVDDQRLEVLPLIEQPGPITATFTADVSAYAGREVNLRFTCFNLAAQGGPNALILDDIAFVPVPEPSTVGIFALGALALGLVRWRCSPHRQRPS